ncbi:hypothetical protein DR_2427 [Deinococcus radiodurans R1 = ATCC 13939 = DSM 20539]|uniref:Probable RNA 2'-phosphotransferase n=2 Tax=Deinococcus radiodurans TaxID=1299 RepID=KPTA_DEIRA|nr:RecName: Full=Probable RNA 2'-phosphotransferase [Deinococcus radiodurans R1 = ATCC 13939 = DSM 20539]AAF11978.1 hypothetical protein DR_2427 [Deinococcus radiodurans R1 = ATCC 13939 = DSM 20539]
MLRRAQTCRSATGNGGLKATVTLQAGFPGVHGVYRHAEVLSNLSVSMRPTFNPFKRGQAALLKLSAGILGRLPSGHTASLPIHTYTVINSAARGHCSFSLPQNRRRRLGLPAEGVPLDPALKNGACASLSVRRWRLFSAAPRAGEGWRHAGTRRVGAAGAAARLPAGQPGAPDAIRREGLRPVHRHHVSLSADTGAAQQVGARRGRAVALVVATGALREAGYDFFRSDNGVWLTDTVPPEYLIRFQIESRTYPGAILRGAHGKNTVLRRWTGIRRLSGCSGIG